MLGDEVRECWEGESWTSRQERVSGAVSAGCVARGTARAGEALRCYGPGAVWLQDEQRRHGPRPSRICHPRAETDMNQATAGTHGCVQTTWQLSKSQGPPGGMWERVLLQDGLAGAGGGCVCEGRVSRQSKRPEQSLRGGKEWRELKGELRSQSGWCSESWGEGGGTRCQTFGGFPGEQLADSDEF